MSAPSSDSEQPLRQPASNCTTLSASTAHTTVLEVKTKYLERSRPEPRLALGKMQRGDGSEGQLWGAVVGGSGGRLEIGGSGGGGQWWNITYLNNLCNGLHLNVSFL